MLKVDKSSQKVTDEALEVCKSLENYVVDTEKRYEFAAVDIKEAKNMLKLVDSKEKSVTKPINEGLKNFRDFFRPAKTRLTSVIDRINSEMFTFRRRQEKEAREKQEEINKNVDKDDMFVPQAEVAIPKTEVKVRRNYKFRVLDINKIDKKYMVPDEKLIQSLVTKNHDKAEFIVGMGSIEIYFTETTF